MAGSGGTERAGGAGAWRGRAGRGGGLGRSGVVLSSAGGGNAEPVSPRSFVWDYSSRLFFCLHPPRRKEQPEQGKSLSILLYTSLFGFLQMLIITRVTQTVQSSRDDHKLAGVCKISTSGFFRSLPCLLQSRVQMLPCLVCVPLPYNFYVFICVAPHMII